MMQPNTLAWLQHLAVASQLILYSLWNHALSRLFSPLAPQLWNDVPTLIRTAHSQAQSKSISSNPTFLPDLKTFTQPWLLASPSTHTAKACVLVVTVFLDCWQDRCSYLTFLTNATLTAHCTLKYWALYPVDAWGIFTLSLLHLL